MLEAQLGYRVEAHKCGLGTLARGTLLTLESGPNNSAMTEYVAISLNHLRNFISCHNRYIGYNSNNASRIAKTMQCE